MNPRVILILATIVVFCTGCVCPGPCYGPAMCGPQACRPMMPPACAAMAPSLMPRPLVLCPLSMLFGPQNPATATPVFRHAPRFRRHAADWPEALPSSYAAQNAYQRIEPDCSCPGTVHSGCSIQRAESFADYSEPSCSAPSASCCAPHLPVRNSSIPGFRGECRCPYCQSQQSAKAGCDDRQPMLGLPHHQPVFGQSVLPSGPSPKAQATPVDATKDVAPDLLKGKNAAPVVPAPVPPADPAPVPQTAKQRINAGEPTLPAGETFPPTEEPLSEELSTEPGSEIQPIALWTPEMRQPAKRRRTKPNEKVEPDEIVVLPGTRITSKRIQ